VFPLEPLSSAAQCREEPVPLWRSYPSLFTVNARSALLLLVQHARPRTVWLPTYLCPELVSVPQKAGTHLAFYTIREDLSCDFYSLRPAADDLVVFISYFGLETFPKDAIHDLHSAGALVVEDASQDFFAAYRRPSEADYLLLSPRKFMGVPDGGVLASLVNPASWFATVRLDEPPAEWFAQAMSACEGRRRDEQSLWYKAFVESEKTAPFDAYRMSATTRGIIDRIPVREWANIRRRNYVFLSERLESYALCPELGKDHVPLGFPLKCDNRESIRQELARHFIYAPVHWHLTNHPLSRKIMTLPCDQRYSEDDMNRMAAAFTDAQAARA
jgi:hypothetical protein